uniref:HDC08293 n=1 Tax=Drosophila melanogaster TaxID=7227 RepID=Q6ILU9_DROME|nr:TPA_inf: HDC08293 [Drosophila melanogaster]
MSKIVLYKLHSEGIGSGEGVGVCGVWDWVFRCSSTNDQKMKLFRLCGTSPDKTVILPFNWPGCRLSPYFSHLDSLEPYQISEISLCDQCFASLVGQLIFPCAIKGYCDGKQCSSLEVAIAPRKSMEPQRLSNNLTD